MTRVGTLQSAPFPGGAGPTTIAANTLQFDFPTPTSLLTITTAGEMRVFADPAGAGALLDSGVFRGLTMGEGGYVAYAKAAMTLDQMQFSDLYAKRVDGTGACTLTATIDAYTSGVRFTPSASGATWIQRTLTGFRGRYTRLSDCTTMEVAPGVARIEPFGHRGILYLDEYSAGARIGSLRFRALAAGGAVSGDPATAISGEVGGFASVSTGTSDAVIYAVENAGKDDGVYVRAFGP
jgi:hypothetical protein